MKRWVVCVAVVGVLIKPGAVRAMGFTGGISTTTVRGGETLTLQGQDLYLTGSEKCSVGWKTGHVTTVDCAYRAEAIMMTREPADGCARPLVVPTIVSITPTEVTIRVPKSLPTGTGKWGIVWGGTYIGGEYDGKQFMQGKEVDVQVTDVGVGFYQCVTKDGKVVGSSSTPKPTVRPSPSPSPLPTISPLPSLEPSITPTPTATSQLRWWMPGEGKQMFITWWYKWIEKLFR